ncbi:MAG TPA: hypothetical protein VFZ59_09670 [Verrucomicrobiae bacterium]|nr:hypothetical protein [Verrucomicrobiae bacterium]
MDTNGVTNEITGIVERNGMFWVEGLPLASGTNDLTLIATDAAGNVSNTNLSVVKSSVTLTITSTPTGESLYTPNGTVNGTVSDTNYAVTVNGVAATVDEYGNWTAQDVPVMGQGTATFEALAHLSGGGGTPVNAGVPLEMPAFVAILNHSVSKGTTFSAPGYFSTSKRTKNYSAKVKADPFGDWTGNWVTTFLGKATDTFQDNNVSQTSVYTWTSTNRGTHYTDSTGADTTTTNIIEDYGSVTGVPDRDVAELGWLGGSGGVGGYPPVLIHHYFARGIRDEWDYGLYGSATAQVGARTQMKLYTGGKARISRKSLIYITGNAASYGRAPDQPWLHTPITSGPDPDSSAGSVVDGARAR